MNRNRIAKYYREHEPMPPKPHVTDLRPSRSTVSHIIGTVIIGITIAGVVAAWFLLWYIAGLAFRLGNP